MTEFTIFFTFENLFACIIAVFEVFVYLLLYSMILCVYQYKKGNNCALANIQDEREVKKQKRKQSNQESVPGPGCVSRYVVKQMLVSSFISKHQDLF